MNEQKKDTDRFNYNNQISQNLLEEIKQRYNITEKQLLSLPQQETIPITIFNKNLSSLETVVKYLKENKKLKNSKIAKKLNRSPKTIWATYQKAKAKHPKFFQETETRYKIPVNIFVDRMLSVLENIVSYLKDQELNNTEIANLLYRSPKTIWTINQRINDKIR